MGKEDGKRMILNIRDFDGTPDLFEQISKRAQKDLQEQEDVIAIRGMIGCSDGNRSCVEARCGLREGDCPFLIVSKIMVT